MLKTRRIKDSGGDYLVCPHCQTHWIVTHIPEFEPVWDAAQGRFRMAEMVKWICETCHNTFEVVRK